MIKNEYKKTVVVWTDDFDDQQILVEIIKSLKLNPVVFKNEKVGPVLKVHCFLILAKGGLIPADFFDTRYVALRTGELTVMFIDESKPLSTKYSVKNTIELDITKPNEVMTYIKNLSLKVDSFSKRRDAMKTKLNRLFYIYTLLKETGRVSKEDVLYRTEISERTFYRDMETLKDICVEMQIEGCDGTYYKHGI